MLFNSIEFAVFLPIVFVLYWSLKGNFTLQKFILVGSSYLFYGWWDWRFLFLILFSTVTDFAAGKLLGNSVDQKFRKRVLWSSIIINLGILGFFKYYNFFVENFVAAFSLFGQHPDISTLEIILPVGISFYTFQTLSYTIDVYRRDLDHERSFLSFAAYVSFFPQLVAGPIERGTNLVPQFRSPRVFNSNLAREGLVFILWGLFKKMVIADNCALFVNDIFGSSHNQPGSTLLIGAVFFAFQIYGDFSGYSDIAIGTARLFGFELMRNFAYPYFSRDIAEFWRRWHISLSTWFRDYVYIPLGGSRGGLWMKIRNTFAIFLLSGFWHGANWTFVIWGALNALYFLPLLLTNSNRKNLGIAGERGYFPTWKESINILVTFSLTVLAWIFFRAESLSHSMEYIGGIFSGSLFEADLKLLKRVFYLFCLIGVFLLTEWFGRKFQCPILPLRQVKSRMVRWSMYVVVIFLILMFAVTEETPFIYFQF